MDDVLLDKLPGVKEYRWWAYDLYKGLPYGFFIRHGKNLQFNNVNIGWKDIEGTWRNAIWVDHATGLHFNGLVTRQAWDDSDEPALLLKNVQDLSMVNCRAVDGTGTFLSIEEGCSDIRITGSDFSKAKIGWLDRREDVSKDPIVEVGNIILK